MNAENRLPAPARLYMCLALRHSAVLAMLLQFLSQDSQLSSKFTLECS